MKRVHNDTGTTGQAKSNASGSPPPAPAPVKGKKRKSEATTQQTVEENKPKRIATPVPAPVAPKPKAQVQQREEPSLLERYHEKHRLLLSTVKQLADPKQADNMKLLREANDCIRFMVQTTQRINAAPSATMGGVAMGRGFSQQSLG